MAITKGAKKAHRASLRKAVFNERRNRTMKNAIKEADKSMSAESLRQAYKAIDKAAKRGIIKKNTAARKKSRLAKVVAKAKAK